MGVQRCLTETVLGKRPCLKQPGANKAGLSAFPSEPGTQQEVGPQAGDCPTHEGLHLGMAISFFPAHSTSFFFLKRVFLKENKYYPQTKRKVSLEQSP